MFIGPVTGPHDLLKPVYQPKGLPDCVGEIFIVKTHATIIARLHLLFSVIALTLTAMMVLKALLCRLKKGSIVFVDAKWK